MKGCVTHGLRVEPLNREVGPATAIYTGVAVLRQALAADRGGRRVMQDLVVIISEHKVHHD
jgi:hypothetical protein